MKNVISNKVPLYLSISILIYFLTLLGLSQFEIEFQVFRIIGELLTIPLILALIFLTCYSAIKLFTNTGTNNNKSNNLAILIISGLTLTMLVLATVMEY